MNSAGAKDALACAMRMLARRDHSEAELRRKLLDRSFAADTVAGVIGRLQELHYIDDRRFARRWAESALKGLRFCGFRLRIELVRRGISEELAAEVISELAAEHDEMGLLAALLDRRFPGFDAWSAPAGEKRRVLNYLQRRGFSTAAIMQSFRLTADDRAD